VLNATFLKNYQIAPPSDSKAVPAPKKKVRPSVSKKKVRDLCILMFHEPMI